MYRFSRRILVRSGGDQTLKEHGFTWPILLRAPGYHTGQHFVRVEQPKDLAIAAASLPGESLLVIEYLDATGSDGKARKGRVMIVDGRLHPLHWAISSDWKVHYFTADMASCADHRAEEARFLSDIAGFLGAPAMAALEAIADRLQLDYGGIDFALAPDGTILLFEANATMNIVPPPPEAIWDYRRQASDMALCETRRMLLARSQNHTAVRPEHEQ